MPIVIAAFPGIVAGAVALSAVAQDGSFKIGFVNTARVLKEAPQARKVEERLKAEFGPREAQLKEKRSEILALEETAEVGRYVRFYATAQA